MEVFEEGDNNKPIKAWVRSFNDIEPSALTQLKNLAGLPFIAPNGVAVMPDVHAGKGSTVGTVIATDRAIIPAAVGVDIGCGMNAVRLSIKASQLPDSLVAIRSRIESVIPVGNNNHTKQDILNANRQRLDKGDSLSVSHVEEIVFHIKKDYVNHAAKQLGTLGGGNHFVELCIDENQDVWIMLHSGSRGVGNVIGSHYIDQAKEMMARYFIELPDQDLAYLPEDTPLFNDYVAAVHWAQDYAMENRKVMMEQVIDALRVEIPIPFTITQEAINCHHNYVAKENHFGRNLWVTRKGAIQAREGSMGIIPGSMGTKSFIVRGKGNPESYCSCSHGAGRKMSRAEAKRTFTLEDFKAQTAGVECQKIDAFIDEIPGAYKDIDLVMANQTDLVEVVHTLKQVMCIKGN